MYYGSSYSYSSAGAVKSPPAQASCWEKLLYPTRRVRHLLLIAALSTVVSMVIINMSISSIADSVSLQLFCFSRPKYEFQPLSNESYKSLYTGS